MMNGNITATLYKKGTKIGLLHKRFCAIAEDKLYVYKNRKKLDKPEKIINLTCDTLINKTDSGHIKKKSFMFTVIPANGENKVTLVSKSETEGENFLSEIRNVILSTPNLNMNCFNIVSVLGRGYFGKVLLVQRKNSLQDKYYAIKTIKKSQLVRENKLNSVIVEKQVLMKSDNPFIIKIDFAFNTETKLYLGLEYMPGGDLKHRIDETTNSITGSDIRLYLAEIAIALEYLHKNKIVYRDVKCQNVLLDMNGHIKLADFGLAKIFDKKQQTTSSFCGTPECIAPEIIQRCPYSYPADWWMYGIMAYELIFKTKPFKHPNSAKLFELICTANVLFPQNSPEATESTISFIKALLQKKPESRMKYEDLVVHPFFNGLDFKDVYERKIMPDYIPPLGDLNIDAEYKYACPADSYATPAELPSKNVFEGFSFIAEAGSPLCGGGGECGECEECEEEEESSCSLHLERVPSQLEML